MTYDFKSSIWQGVYKNFEEARGDMSVFEGEIWLDNLGDKALEAVEAHGNQRSISSNTTTLDYILTPVASTLAQAGKSLRILDFGGGMAASFYPLVDALETDAKIEFHIVENSLLCTRAKEIIPQDSRLYFHDKLPDTSDSFDIVHVGSSLQYIEDWKGLIQQLYSYNPSYFILADLTAGDIPETFATLQHFYGREIPAWFFRLNDIIENANQHSYRLAYKALYEGSYFGRRMSPPMENIPEAYRLASFCQLMFKRDDSKEHYTD